MRLRSLPFLLREAWLNLGRHGLMTVAAISAIAIALSLIGTFALTFYEADGATQHALSEFEMRVFLRPTISRAAGQVVQKRVAALAGVQRVDYLTREQVFAAQAQQSALDVTGIPNLMPDTLNVRLADAKQARPVADTVRGYREVESVQMMDTELQTFLRLIRMARLIGTAAGIVLTLAALLVVANTIRLSVFSRRREIKIMQIVGANAGFIRLPLLLEGLLHGMAGGAIAALLLWSVGRYVGGMVIGSLPQFAPYSAPVDYAMVSAYLLLSGAALGSAGSVLAIRRYLKG